MDEELMRTLLGSIASDDPTKRAIAVGVVAWLAVQFGVKPWVKDKRWYVPAAILVACLLNMVAASVTDQMYVVAGLYGVVVGLVASGGHELAKQVARLMRPAN